jgi:hypothetical protein
LVASAVSVAAAISQASPAMAAASFRSSQARPPAIVRRLSRSFRFTFPIRVRDRFQDRIRSSRRSITTIIITGYSAAASGWSLTTSRKKWCPPKSTTVRRPARVCLTKSYSPSGLVVFADVCTKESASASVYGNASAAATQVPTTPVAATAVPMSVVPTTPDYAGRTYEDYLAMNPQLSQPQASAPQPQAMQKN